MTLYKKYYVYLIGTKINKKVISYVGYTKNVKERLKLHNTSKGAKFTRGKKWKILYVESYNTKSTAMKNEYLLKKNYKLRNSIKKKFLSKI